ncbi:MAG TPA: DUF2238 domain-containing protein [Syntrophales bacterium]|nr:DUF2238 domain-containing protein [Syntrophales bacterium]
MTSDKGAKLTVSFMLAAVIASGISPFDFATWILEVFPILAGLPFVFYFGRKGRITNLLLLMIAAHAAVLALGGHYSYARVPLGEWFVQMGWAARNNYDKIGHFFQGFTPAIVIREILVRNRAGMGNKTLSSLMIILACGGLSSLYEIVEWIAAVILKSGADEFLGTQGYEWDTQSDMLLALIGAAVAVLFLSREHDRQLCAK